MSVSALIFILATLITIGFFSFRIRTIVANIRLGRAEKLDDQKGLRFKNMLLLAFGQKKMFQRPLPALLHFFVYAGFIIINIEILEIVLDGVTGSHRLFAPLMGNSYAAFISAFEILAVLVMLGCAVFLIRRNVLRLKRFHSSEMTSWPRSDANIILITEILLMSSFLSMNACDQLLQEAGKQHYIATGSFLISAYLQPIFSGISSEGLHVFERSAWWFHILGVFAFAVYVTYSKHLHIFLAFPNSYYMRLSPWGEIDNMPEITSEVKLMLDSAATPPADAPPPPAHFGAKDISDLSWKDILDAYSCTECGRCTSACPANQTGKKLSPRRIMMATRDRADELGKFIRNNGQEKEDGKSLLKDYISVEEVNACTSCQACVFECPVSINPLRIIIQLRRFLIMEESNSPAEWNLMFSNLENNFAPWQFSPEDRLKWTEA